VRILSFGLLAVLAGLMILHVFIAFEQALITDEYETIATARFISEGKIIFKDFFQHHGTLPYFLYALPFLATGDIPSAIAWMKIISLLIFCFTLALLAVLALAIGRASASPFIWFLPVYFVLNDVIWWRYATQIRVDGLMNCFLIAAFYLLHHYQKYSRTGSLISAGFFGSAAIFCKQSAALYLVFFLLWYFRFDFKKYFHFFLGALPLAGLHAAYFIRYGAVGDFFRCFVGFNLAAHPKGTFTFRERLWFLTSPLTPRHIKGLYLVAFVSTLVFVVVLIKKTGSHKNRFFMAMLFSLLCSGLATFLMKTPYPQYYMPLQILGCLTGIFLLNFLKQFRKLFMAICLVLFLGPPLITRHFFIDMAYRRVIYSQQVETLGEMQRYLPPGLRALGAMPALTLYQPAHYFWFYPFIFIDSNRDFLIAGLNEADVVFYDTTLSLLAPKKFKHRLFNEWLLVGHYWLPSAWIHEFDPVTIFVKDRRLAEEMKAGMAQTGIKPFSAEQSVLSEPFHVPVFFRAALLRGDERRVLDGGHYSYSSTEPEKVTLIIDASSHPEFFDRATNIFFLRKPQIAFSLQESSVVFEVLYEEYVDLYYPGVRRDETNKLSIRGSVTFSCNIPPQRTRNQAIPGGYRIEMDFLGKDLTFTREARQAEVD
jgi:hypothetical protein